MSELKRCPFCGSEDIYSVDDGRDNSNLGIHRATEWAIGCKSCRIPEAISHISKQEAIESWNRRANDQ